MIALLLTGILALLILIVLVLANIRELVTNLHAGFDLLADVTYLQAPEAVMHQVFDAESVRALLAPYRPNTWPPPRVTRSNAWPPPSIA